MDYTRCGYPPHPLRLSRLERGITHFTSLPIDECNAIKGNKIEDLKASSFTSRGRTEVLNDVYRGRRKDVLFNVYSCNTNVFLIQRDSIIVRLREVRFDAWRCVGG